MSVKFSKWTFRISDEQTNEAFKTYMRRKAFRGMHVLAVIAVMMTIHDSYVYAIGCQGVLPLVFDIFVLPFTLSFYALTASRLWLIEVLQGAFYFAMLAKTIYLSAADPDHGAESDQLRSFFRYFPFSFLTWYAVQFLTNSNYVLTQYFVIPTGPLCGMLVMGIRILKHKDALD